MRRNVQVLAVVGAVLGLMAFIRAIVVRSRPAPEDHVSRVLRICADPNNLPYSNSQLQGFDNRIAEVIAKELGADLQYEWWAQRRGFVRNTLAANRCDLIMSVPTALDTVLVTTPYYRSTYVFLYRKDAGVDIDSFESPLLRSLRIGVQLIGDDYTNTPPAHALAHRGITANVRGYPVMADYSQPNPPARIVEAVASGEVDVAVVWGPLAGYFADRQSVKLRLRPIPPDIRSPLLPFTYEMSMGVRRGEGAFRDEVNRAIARNQSVITRILVDYGVPGVDGSL